MNAALTYLMYPATVACGQGRPDTACGCSPPVHLWMRKRLGPCCVAAAASPFHRRGATLHCLRNTVICLAAITMRNSSYNLGSLSSSIMRISWPPFSLLPGLIMSSRRVSVYDMDQFSQNKGWKALRGAAHGAGVRRAAVPWSHASKGRRVGLRSQPQWQTAQPLGPATFEQLHPHVQERCPPGGIPLSSYCLLRMRLWQTCHLPFTMSSWISPCALPWALRAKAGQLHYASPSQTAIRPPFGGLHPAVCTPVLCSCHKWVFHQPVLSLRALPHCCCLPCRSTLRTLSHNQATAVRRSWTSLPFPGMHPSSWIPTIPARAVLRLQARRLQPARVWYNSIRLRNQGKAPKQTESRSVRGVMVGYSRLSRATRSC